MRILALEPYYGGSHKAFLDGWIKNSKHEWTLLTLPAYKWKWRMRHSAITFAEQVGELINAGQNFDAVFCSDMLNLAEFAGLTSKLLCGIEKVVYFHENQLTYPVRFESERDYQFAMTNLTTAASADKVWFNSSFHRDSFLSSAETFLKKMPDYPPLETLRTIRNKSHIYPQGITDIKASGKRKPGPARLLWAARWEHDKNPEDFFEALKILKSTGIDFRLSVIGESFREQPQVFDWAKEHFAEHIDRWGYQQSRKDYEDSLIEADIIVSTAKHEFFGISIVEAVSADCLPIVPNRLAYPEILQLGQNKDVEKYFYNGRVNDLAEKLTEFIKQIEQGLQADIADTVQRFKWKNLAPVLDKAIAK